MYDLAHSPAPADAASSRIRLNWDERRPARPTAPAGSTTCHEICPRYARDTPEIRPRYTARLLELLGRVPHRVPNLVVGYTDRVVLDIFARDFKRVGPERHGDDRICDRVQRCGGGGGVDDALITRECLAQPVIRWLDAMVHA